MQTTQTLKLNEHLLDRIKEVNKNAIEMYFKDHVNTDELEVFMNSYWWLWVSQN
jgi:hypothetical protein